MVMKKASLFLIFFLILPFIILSGCGGGDGSSAPTPTPSSAVSNAIAAPTSLIAGGATGYEFSFNATSGVPTGSTITVEFPAGFNLAGAKKTDYIDSVPIQSIVGQTITYSVNASYAATAAGGLMYGFFTRTDGIMNPPTPGTYLLKIHTSNDTEPVSMSVTITSTGNAVSNAIAAPTSLIAGGATGYEFSFNATSGVPTGSTITVEFPAGFNLAGAKKTDYIDSVPIQSIVGQTITYSVNASYAATAAGGLMYGFFTRTDGIMNPPTPGTYLLKIHTSNDTEPVSMSVTIK